MKNWLRIYEISQKKGTRYGMAVITMLEAADGGMSMIPTRQQLEDGRNCGFIKYGYFWSFCELNKSCEQCDKTIRIGCVMKRKIEEFQTKRILRICKPAQPKEEK